MPSNVQARRQGARNQFGVEDLMMNRQYGRLQHHNKPVKETLKNVAAAQWSSKAPRPEEEHIKYQFWPTAIAMGSLVGREFIQVRLLNPNPGVDLPLADEIQRCSELVANTVPTRLLYLTDLEGTTGTKHLSSHNSENHTSPLT